MKHFTTTLAEMRGGLVNEEMAEAIQKATVAVRETGRKAKVQLTITIHPYDGEAGEIERLSIEDAIKSTLPEKKKGHSIFFIDSNNNLQRQQTIAGIEAEATPAKKGG